MSTRRITGRRADRKFAHARPTDFSLFDSSLTTHPTLLPSFRFIRSLLFSGTDFTLVRPVISGYSLSRPFASPVESKGDPFPGLVSRPANFIMYILPTTGHLCLQKKMVGSAGYSSGRRMRAKMIAADNCAPFILCGGGGGGHNCTKY